MRFITLTPREPRCRPEKGFTTLHNDCGNQTACARRLAANTVGAPERDFSKTAQPLMGVFICSQYLPVDTHSERAGAPK